MSVPKATTKRNKMKPYFGYDPIDKLFKVLCVSDDYVCRVLTLGTEEVTWRKVECLVPHQPLHTEICIDGVLYYLAKRVRDGSPASLIVVCFDLRLERFKFREMVLNYVSSAFMINYHGKLGILSANSYCVGCYTKTIELRVLVDEVVWGRKVFILPYYWKNLNAKTDANIVGMTNAGEIVFFPYYVRDPFYIFYFSTVDNSVVRVEIDFGIEPFKAQNCSKISTFLNHVESVELMDYDFIIA